MEPDEPEVRDFAGLSRRNADTCFLEEMPEGSRPSPQELEMQRHPRWNSVQDRQSCCWDSERLPMHHQAPYVAVVQFTLMPGLGRLASLCEGRSFRENRIELRENYVYCRLQSCWVWSRTSPWRGILTVLYTRMSGVESKFRCLWEAAPGDGAKPKQHRELVGPVALLRDTGLVILDLLTSEWAGNLDFIWVTEELLFQVLARNSFFQSPWVDRVKLMCKPNEVHGPPVCSRRGAGRSRRRGAGLAVISSGLWARCSLPARATQFAHAFLPSQYHERVPESASWHVKGYMRTYRPDILKSFFAFKKEVMSFLNPKWTYERDVPSRKGVLGVRRHQDRDREKWSARQILG